MGIEGMVDENKKSAFLRIYVVEHIIFAFYSKQLALSS